MPVCAILCDRGLMKALAAVEFDAFCGVSGIATNTRTPFLFK